MLIVQNKVAVVFGGNGGIGKCTVLELFNRGVKGVLIADLNQTNINSFIQNEISLIYGENKAKFIKCSVANLKEVQSVFDYCINLFGCLDIVINCVGIADEKNPINTVTVNLIGALHIINEAYNRLPSCKSSTTEEAVICSVASYAGFYPAAVLPSYCASKSAMITYAHCMAKKKEIEGDLSVKLVTLCPTTTETPMFKYGLQKCKAKVSAVEEALMKTLQAIPAQKAESAAKCIVDIIQNGNNGSFWLSHRGRDAEGINYDAIPGFLNSLE